MKDQGLILLLAGGLAVWLFMRNRGTAEGAGAAAASGGGSPQLLPQYPESPEEFKATVTSYGQTLSIPSPLATANQLGVSHIWDFENRYGVSGNEQLIRASYEWEWANKLVYTKMPYSQWNALRSQYISRYGGEEASPDLSMILGAANRDKWLSPIEYLGLVNQYRGRMGRPALAGMGAEMEEAGV